MLEAAILAEVDIEWPLNQGRVPDDVAVIMDLLEFLYEAVGNPVEGNYHDFFRHWHLSWDVKAGQASYVEAINRVFSKSGVAFEISADGIVKRILRPDAAALLVQAIFHTGDAETDRLLEASRAAIIDPHLDMRRIGLEQLFDAFERMKTLEPGLDKKASADAMLNCVPCGPVFRRLLGTEAVALTGAGNSLRIRHSETSQELMETADEIDYLFFRLFDLVRLLLRASGRGG